MNPFEKIATQEVAQKNIAVTEEITPDLFESIQEQLKAGASLQVIPKGSKGLIIRKEISPELIKQVSDLTSELQGVGGIIDQAAAEKANKVLKRAKTLIKDLENDRKKMDSVLNDEKAENKAMEDTIVSQLSILVNAVNGSITAFQKEEDRKAQIRQQELQRQKDEELRLAQIERDRVSKIKNTILEFETNCLNAINSATMADIDSKISIMSNLKLSETTYQELLPEATIKYNELVTKFQARKTDLLRLADLEKKNKEQADQLKLQQQSQQEADQKALDERKRQQEEEALNQEMNDTANIQMGSELKAAMNTGAKGVQKVWKFDEENIDLALLPLEYHTFDKAKIKEAIAAGAREIPGVNIFQDIRNVSR